MEFLTNNRNIEFAINNRKSEILNSYLEQRKAELNRLAEKEKVANELKKENKLKEYYSKYNDFLIKY